MAKLELKDILAAIDTNSKEVWDELSDEEKKEVGFYVLNRFVSSVGGTRKMKEHYLLLVNQRYNKDLFDLLNKHNKLLWQLLCSCSHESKEIQSHPWIPLKREKNKKEAWLAEQFPNMKLSDVEALAAITTDAEIKKYAEALGWDKKQINAIKL